MLKLLLLLTLLCVLSLKVHGSYYRNYNRYNNRYRSQNYDGDNRYRMRSQNNGDNSDPVDCSDGGFFQKPNPESCNSFYKCDNGRPVLVYCADRTEYSPSRRVCVFPGESDCALRSGRRQYDTHDDYDNEQVQRPSNQNEPGQRATRPTETSRPNGKQSDSDDLDNLTFLD